MADIWKELKATEAKLSEKRLTPGHISGIKKPPAAGVAKHLEPSRRRGPTCAFPECDEPISRHATTGLCRQHIHAAGICNCMQCRRSKT